jgi:hypothetical protein
MKQIALTTNATQQIIACLIAQDRHLRAARIVTKRWLKHMSWQAFLNRVSS